MASTMVLVDGNIKINGVVHGQIYNHYGRYMVYSVWKWILIETEWIFI